MATRKQRAANRANAQKSTGPKTPEGKAAVHLNALKHGLTAENAIINGEDEEDFDELRTAFLEQFQPAGPLETALVHQIVMAQWQLARCRGIETGLFELGLFDLLDENEARFDFYNQPQKLAYVFRKRTDTLSVFGRYQARIERSFFRALHELQRLQAARQQPDPPPASKTISAEQTQPAPETQPSPLQQNGLPPAANQDGIAEIARVTVGRSNGPGKLLRMNPGFAAPRPAIRPWALAVASAPAR